MEISWDEWMLSITMTHREGMNGSVNCDVNQHDAIERYRYEKQLLLR
jgi:Cu2+-containing amine oxidase